MITVIIPYYQRTPGILAKALASIAAQQNCPLPVHVIVVDDASPAPAAAEIARNGAPPYTLQVIVQTNAGPGAARNTGLDNAPKATKYIAFLDSDDEWTPDHLARAFAALESGYHFYFADLIQLGATVGAFQRGGRIQLQDHPAVPGAPDGIHEYTGDLIDQTIRGNLIGTPTVVYRFDTHRLQRFRPEFKNAGEDYLFWMELARSGARVTFSSQCEVRCGRGVNIYAASGWGTDQHMLRIHNEMKYRKLTGQLFPLNPQQNLHIQKSIRDLRTAFARDLLHRVSHRKALPWPVVRQHFKLDVWSFLGLPANLLKSFLAGKK